MSLQTTRHLESSIHIACISTAFKKYYFWCSSENWVELDTQLSKGWSQARRVCHLQMIPWRPIGWGPGSTHHTDVPARYNLDIALLYWRKFPIQILLGLWINPRLIYTWIFVVFYYFFCLSPLFFTELCYSQSKRLMMFGSGLFQDQSSSFFPRLQWEVNSGPVWKPGFTCSSGLDRGTWCSASPLWN